MKILFIFILICTTFCQPPKCIHVSCKCLDRKIANSIKFYCPNEKAIKCYNLAKCQLNNKGRCEFAHSVKSIACLENAKLCKKTGCSSHICSDSGVITTCEFKPKYACYRNQKCIVNSNGQCGWNNEILLAKCLKNFPI